MCQPINQQSIVGVDTLDKYKIIIKLSSKYLNTYLSILILFLLSLLLYVFVDALYVVV